MAAMRRNEHLIISGFEIDFQKGGVKHLNLRVRKDGTIHISAPYRTSMRDVERFINDNRDWIIARMSVADDTVHPYTDGSITYILGRPYTLHILSGDRDGFSIGDDDIYLTISSEDVEGAVREMHRSVMKEVAPPLLNMWSSVTGLQYDEFRIRYMSTRWGTCNHRERRIWLSTRLAERPPECIEYVVLHEICHLRYADHGAGFKGMLDMYMPDWKRRKKVLNTPLYR